MLYIDTKYVNLISSELDGFKWNKPNLGTCRCPICGDSVKDKSKRRFYFYVHHKNQSELSVRCHNCGYGARFSTFLKYQFAGYFREYAMEKFKSGAWESEEKVEEPKPIEIVKKVIDLPSIADLPDFHSAYRYCSGRMIPEIHYPNIYFAKEFDKFALSLDPDKTDLVPESRIVFPCCDREGNLLSVNARSMDKGTKDSMKYIKINVQKNYPKKIYYGLERTINPAKPVYILEGNIDSLFIPNSIAVGSLCKLQIDELPFPLQSVVIAYDNEPYSGVMIGILRCMIQFGFKVVLWPEELLDLGKDINDWVLNGLTSEEIVDIMKANTFSGMRGLLELSRWAKNKEFANGN